MQALDTAHELDRSADGLRTALAALVADAAAERQAASDEVWTIRALRRAGRQLEAVIDWPVDPADDRASALSAAALALEAAAVARRPGGTPHAIARHRLVEAVGRHLDNWEQDVLCARRGYRITGQDVRAAATAAVHAAHERRAAAAGRPRDAVHPDLMRLDDGALELAATAMRAAMNLALFARAVGPSDSLTPDWAARLATGAADIDQAARRILGSGPLDRTTRGRTHAALAVRVGKDERRAMARTPLAAEAFPADALAALRSRWVERAGHELLILHRSSARPADQTREITARAARLLVVGQLAQRPAAFDHHGAWAAGDEGLTEAAAGSHRQGRLTEDPHRRPVLRNVARAALAASLLDARLQPPRTDAP